MSCTEEPVATIALRYADRQILVEEPRPNGTLVCSICAPDISR
jgi:hypothetical protein